MCRDKWEGNLTSRASRGGKRPGGPTAVTFWVLISQAPKQARSAYLGTQWPAAWEFCVTSQLDLRLQPAGLKQHVYPRGSQKRVIN